MADSDPQTNETAVIDRFEGDIAVLLVGAAQRAVDVSREQLPRDAYAGQWLRVQLEDDRIVHVEPDADATEAAQQRIQEKLAWLRRGDHLR